MQHQLEQYAEPGTEGLLFTSPEGGPIRLENFRRRAWAPACERAGVGHLRIHELRHACASLAIAADADVKVLQRMLGHASAARTLDLHGHLLPGQAEEIAERLDRAAMAAQPAADAPVVDLTAGRRIARMSRGPGSTASVQVESA